MNIEDILTFMGDCGAVFPSFQLEEIIDYFSNMILDGRFLAIYQDSKISGFITFSLCKNYEPFYRKSSWQFLGDDKSSKKIYIETMVCKKWNKYLRKELEKVLVEKYPQIEQAIWFRDKRDSDFKIIKRIEKCTL